MLALRSGFASSFVLLAAACGGGEPGGTKGAGGAAIAGAGGAIVGTGGTTTGGAGNAVGTGGVAPGTGGTITQTDGGPGTGGAANCTNTQTDSTNCGTCGHGCRGTCTAGKCDPAWFVCFDRTVFDSCDAYCGSIGATCSTGCGTSRAPWLGWVDGSQLACNAHVAPNAIGTDQLCSSPLPAQTPGGVFLFDCCCVE